MMIGFGLQITQVYSGASSISPVQRALFQLFPGVLSKTVRCELPAQPGWTAYAAGQVPGGLMDCAHPLPGVELSAGPYHKLNCAEALP